MASLTQWRWVWANSGRWWRTGKPGVLQSMCRVRSHTLLSYWIFLRIYSFLRIMLEVLDNNNKIITDTNYWILALLNRCFHSYNILLFSCSVLSDFLWSHGLRPTRLPGPSPFPRVCSNYCPSSWWCHPTISSSVIPCPLAFNQSQRVGHDWTTKHAPFSSIPFIFIYYYYYFELCIKFYLEQNEDFNPGDSISDSSEKLLQSGSGGKSIYKVLVKGEFNTMKHSFYKRFFVSHEDLITPWRDLLFL